MSARRLRTRLLVTVCCIGAGLVCVPDEARCQISLRGAGLHGGAIVSSGDHVEPLIGVQAHFGLPRSLELSAALSARPDFPDDPLGAWGGTAGWGYFALRVSPPGPARFVSVGLGLAVGYTRAREEARRLLLSDTEVVEVGVIGVAVPIGRVRPFADVYVVGPVRDRSEARSHLMAGISLRWN